jgi:hypothetical protein
MKKDYLHNGEYILALEMKKATEELSQTNLDYVLAYNTHLGLLKRKADPYALEDLFANETFKQFATYFLDESRTVGKVAELSGISRQTIATIIKKHVKREYISTEWDLNKKGKPLKFKIELLTDFISRQVGLDLTEDELKTVNRLLSDEILYAFITKNNFQLDMPIMKIISLIMNECVFNQAFKNGDMDYSEFLKEVKTKKPDKTMFLLMEYAKNNEKLLDKISSKLRSSRFLIFFPISHIYNLSLHDVGGNTWMITEKELTKDWFKRYNDYITPKRSIKK